MRPPRFDERIDEMAEATTYLLVDALKCAGCESCMLACSLVNLGQENPALSRIQIAGDAGVSAQDPGSATGCASCSHALCLDVCPVDALSLDQTGRMRRREGRCIDCGRCLDVCPSADAPGSARRVSRCDLCASAPFWSHEGGPEGKQACVEACPTGAISLYLGEVS